MEYIMSVKGDLFVEIINCACAEQGSLLGEDFQQVISSYPKQSHLKD